MAEKVIKDQKGLDKLDPKFDGVVYIDGGTRYDPLILNIAFEYARIIVRGESFVSLRGSSHAELWGSSHAVLRESSHAELWGSSHAVLRESSHAVLRESSHAELYGEAMVSAKSAKEIVTHGYNVISVTKTNSESMTIVVNETSHLMIVPDFEPTLEEYLKRYPVSVVDGKAIMYKAVHLVDGKYLSDYNRSFEYVIGEVKEHTVAEDDNSCAPGLHVAHKSWAHMFGAGWGDLAILEVEVPIESIKVSTDCDGKVRTSTLKVVRAVPEEEWFGELN